MSRRTGKPDRSTSPESPAPRHAPLSSAPPPHLDLRLLGNTMRQAIWLWGRSPVAWQSSGNQDGIHSFGCSWTRAVLLRWEGVTGDQHLTPIRLLPYLCPTRGAWARLGSCSTPLHLPHRSFALKTSAIWSFWWTQPCRERPSKKSSSRKNERRTKRTLKSARPEWAFEGRIRCCTELDGERSITSVGSVMSHAFPGLPSAGVSDAGSGSFASSGMWSVRQPGPPANVVLHAWVSPYTHNTVTEAVN